MERVKLPIKKDQDGVEVARAVNRIADGMLGWVYLEKLTAAPPTDKTYEGMVVYADGTVWNPGAGEGFYGYYNSTWNSLG